MVVKDRDPRASMAHPALCKGRLHQDTVQQAAECILRLGHRTRALLNADSGPAMVDLKRGVVEALGQPNCPSGEAGGLRPTNPRAMALLRMPSVWPPGVIRALMLALEARIQGEVPVAHPIMLWLAERAA